MEYMRCKACGYIMEATKLGASCPACGVPAAQFEAWTSPIKGQRKKLLDLHIHPVLVHFPQAYAVSLVLLALVLALLPAGGMKTLLSATTLILALLLPFGGIAALAAGVLDAKLRFRRLTTPILVRKLIVGILFILLSLGGAFVALILGLSGLGLGIFALLELLALACGTLLGLWGSGLMTAAFPG